MKKVSEVRPYLRGSAGRGSSILAVCLTLALTGGLLLALPITSAIAQAPSQLPSGAVPGRELPQPLMVAPPGPGGSIVVPRASAAEAPAGAEQVSFTLTAVDIQGATAFSAAELQTSYAALLGKQISVADAFKIANEIELKYRGAGYVTSRVLVPEQAIEGGRFRIAVVEGFISSIVVQGDIGPAKAAIERLLAPLVNVTPVNVAEIERRLLLANDLAGLTIRGNLEPAANTPGASVMVVKSERKDYDASLTLDNRNSPYLGGAEWLGSASWNSFGSNADQLSLRLKQSSPWGRSWSVGGGYSGLFSDDGLTASFNSSFARSYPAKELKRLEIQSDVLTNAASVTYPLIRSRMENLRLTGEFEYRMVDTDLLQAPYNRDRLSILRAGISYDRTDSFDGISAIRATMHRGLDILNATDAGDPLASRSDGHSSYTKWSLDLTRVQQLPASFSLLGTATGQYTRTPLLASEEIALGGPSFGRGFDTGEVSGDNGWAVSLELRYTPEWLQAIFPDGMQLYTFIDRGQVWNIGSVTPTNDRINVTTAGGGFRVNITKNLFASLELARGLSRPQATISDKPKVFFSINTHF